MPLPTLQPPPLLTPMFDSNGNLAEVWRAFYTRLQLGVEQFAAPVDAQYLTATSNGNLTNEVNLGALGSGYLRIKSTIGIAVVSSGFPSVSQTNPANPAGTASVVGVMMGLAGTITPSITGRIQVTITGTIFNATAIADGGKVQMRTGSGAVPANGDALTGTAAGGLVEYIAATVAEKAPFALAAIITGLTLGAARWIDVSLAAITGGTATIADLSVTALEV